MGGCICLGNSLSDLDETFEDGSVEIVELYFKVANF